MRPEKLDETTIQLEQLEMQLRRLASLELPEGLEARLIAAIPHALQAARAHRSRPATLRWVAGAGMGAAALLALLVTFLWQADDSPHRMLRLDAQVTHSAPAQLASNNAKETDPCNILPPFADWR